MPGKALSRISPKKNSSEFSKVFLSRIDTELPTMLYDCTFFPGEITIIGMSAANILLTGKVRIIINFNIFFSISSQFFATANFTL